MKIQYQIFEIKIKSVAVEYNDYYRGNQISSEYITVLEPYLGLNSFDSIEEAIQHLSTLDKGKYTILTVYENL